MSQLNARLIKRIAPRTMLGVGVSAIAIGALALLLVTISGSGLPGILASLVVITASLGFIAPNATALALAKIDNQSAGSAAALLGFLQLTIGAVVAPIIGIIGMETAIPMGLGIATFGVLSLLAFLVLSPRADTAHSLDNPLKPT